MLPGSCWLFELNAKQKQFKNGLKSTAKASNHSNLSLSEHLWDLLFMNAQPIESKTARFLRYDMSQTDSPIDIPDKYIIISALQGTLDYKAHLQCLVYFLSLCHTNGALNYKVQ